MCPQDCIQIFAITIIPMIMGLRAVWECIEMTISEMIMTSLSGVIIVGAFWVLSFV